MPTRKQRRLEDKKVMKAIIEHQEKIVDAPIDMKITEAIQKAAKEEGVGVNELLEDVFGGGMYIAEKNAEETVVTLKYVNPWTAADQKVETKGPGGEETPLTIRTYRRLRDTFPPVSAGVEYSKSFTSGGGFEVTIDNPEDSNQKEAKKLINDFNRNIYQDEVTRGADAIFDILLDEAFTVGCSAAEIVYSKFKDEKPDPTDYLKESTPEELVNGAPSYISRELQPDDWKELGGIVQLKIVDDAINRMKPYRNQTTYKIEYWTVDEESINSWNSKQENKDRQRVVSILLPWQVLWLGWDRRGSSLTGTSLVASVAKTALMLEDIFDAVGISFKKWSDRKYFFILGSDKTGRSWAPPKVANFLRDVRKMTTEHGTGIAVPSGFEIKDMGGEVFEGSQIIDDLTSLICAGMRYPRTFLEQGKTQEGQSAWLAWIVTYAGHQKLLRRTIEHQLWARHLFCLMGGTTTKVSRQGQKVENQQVIPIYIPKMAWKSEGKWHIEQKINELTKILNVANPVSPELKLELESDIALTLGYSELSLDNSRKVLKMRQEISVIEADVDKMKAEILKEITEDAKTDKEFKDSLIPIILGTTVEAPEPEPSPEPKVGEDGIPEEPRGDNPSRPLPVPLKRLAGGVSRYNKDTAKPNAKEMAKEPGDTRQAKPSTGTVKPPKKAEESEEGEEMVQFDTYEEMLTSTIQMREHRDKHELYMKMIDMLDKMSGGDS
jgi:hypothetical protein